jgi:hypothetical protein
MSVSNNQAINDHWFHTYRQWDAKDSAARLARDHEILKARMGAGYVSPDTRRKVRRELWSKYLDEALRDIAATGIPLALRDHWRNRLETILPESPTAEQDVGQLLDAVETCANAEDPYEEMERQVGLAKGAPSANFVTARSWLSLPKYSPPKELLEFARENMRDRLRKLAFNVHMLRSISKK